MTVQSDRGSRRFTILEKVLTTFTALLALGTAILGLMTAQANQAKDQAQSSAAAKGSDLSTLQGQYDQLKSMYDQLQAQNNQLKSQLGIGGPAATAPTTGVTVRHNGTLALARSGGIRADLDAPQSDPQWSASPDSTAGDVGFIAPTELYLYNSTAALLLSTKADYNSCHGQTGYSTAPIDPGRLAPGQNLCIKTSDKRYSALVVIQRDENIVSFSVTTYDPPES